jgi:hypothetical protein
MVTILARSKIWTFNPASGGVPIPEPLKGEVRRRIERVAEAEFKGKYTRLEIKCRGQFCYVDAFEEPRASDGWPPADWHETKEQHVERLRSTPTHLCRLRYFGGDRWGFGFYTYSHEKYELSVYPDGNFLGIPETAFITAASMYLQGG